MVTLYRHSLLPHCVSSQAERTRTRHSRGNNLHQELWRWIWMQPLELFQSLWLTRITIKMQLFSKSTDEVMFLFQGGQNVREIIFRNDNFIKMSENVHSTLTDCCQLIVLEGTLCAEWGTSAVKTGNSHLHVILHCPLMRLNDSTLLIHCMISPVAMLELKLIPAKTVFDTLQQVGLTSFAPFIGPHLPMSSKVCSWEKFLRKVYIKFTMCSKTAELFVSLFLWWSHCPRKLSQLILINIGNWNLQGRVHT